MTDWLRDTGHAVNHKRVERLMQTMGLQSVLPRRRTSVLCPGHKVYPYLLRGLAIERRWRTVKYEHVYLHDHATVPDLVTGLGQYLTFYNSPCRGSDEL